MLSFDLNELISHIEIVTVHICEAAVFIAFVVADTVHAIRHILRSGRGDK